VFLKLGLVRGVRAVEATISGPTWMREKRAEWRLSFVKNILTRYYFVLNERVLFF
jgi:hypothetical protein